MAETNGLLNRRTLNWVPRVRIPPSPPACVYRNPPLFRIPQFRVFAGDSVANRSLSRHGGYKYELALALNGGRQRSIQIYKPGCTGQTDDRISWLVSTRVTAIWVENSPKRENAGLWVEGSGKLPGTATAAPIKRIAGPSLITGAVAISNRAMVVRTMHSLGRLAFSTTIAGVEAGRPAAISCSEIVRQAAFPI